MDLLILPMTQTFALTRCYDLKSMTIISGKKLLLFCFLLFKSPWLLSCGTRKRD